MMSSEQVRLARHALGLPNERRTSYRNRYYAPVGSTKEIVWKDLVTQGLALRGAVDGSNVAFYLTEAGAKAAIMPSERLDRDDFPAPR